VTRTSVPAVLALGTCLAGWPSPVSAQSASPCPSFTLAVGPSRFTANTARWGLHVGAAWHLPGEFCQLSLGAVAFHGPAGADSWSPGISSLGLEVAVATHDPRRAQALHLLFTFGVAYTRIDARLQEAALWDCRPELGCMAEDVVSYHTGTYRAWVPGVALELPLSSVLAFRPHGRVLYWRNHPPWGTNSVARLDVGFTWRP